MGWTSFDMVKYLRRRLALRKVGHAGTLDPLATGLLILCTDAACSQISYYQQLPKTYEGLLRLGESRPSHDLETAVETSTEVGAEAEATLRSAVTRYQGKLLQRPPAFSAIKVLGQRAYALARSGRAPQLPAREVHIYAFELLWVDIPWVSFRLRCSKGTYVRSIVRDLGQDLNTGAALHALCRTAIGDTSLKDAHSLEKMASWTKTAPK